MPFPVRPIHPTHLSNGELPETVDDQLECVTNATLAQAMRQLACLLRQADDLFLDLGTQCNNINQTTVRINKRVERLREKVENYNPKKAKLPAGDLGTFSKLKVHFKTEYPIETNLFTKENRTQAIKTLYSQAGDGNETKVNRDDVAFVCVPVLSDPDKKRNLYLEIETRLPSNYEEFSSRLDDPDTSRKQGNIALKSELVRVDVSGKSFARMTDYRRSLLPANPRRRRRKNRDRRNTLAGGEKFNTIVENQNRTRSHEGQRKTGRSATPGDVDISLDATTGSSLCTGTIPDMDTSLTSSNAEKTLSDIHLPPPLPELKSNAQMKKLRSMGNKKRGESSNNPFIDNDSDYQHYANEEGQLSPIFSDKDFGQDSYYESLSRLRPVPGRSTRDAQVMKGSNPDGALSSSGIWTASVSEGSDRDDNVVNTPSHPEITTPRVLQRPHSSLSMGVISDTESAAETTHEESNDTLTVVQPTNADEGEEGSIHSCDTEGYYTTFHDFDGFKEVANELKFIDPNENANPIISKVDGNSNLFISEEKDEVVFRKKSKRPPLPRRHSSLLRDNRESTDTVIHISDLQEFKTGNDAHDLSNDISFEFSVAGSDIESTEHIQRLELKTAMTSRHIPSMCVVTPPLSDEESRKTSANTSLNISRSSSEGPDKNQVIVNNMQTYGDNNFDEKQGSYHSDNGNHRSSGNSSDKECLDSDNSVMTVDSGKLVSITPDIVKPVKECKPDLTKENDEEKQQSTDHKVSDTQDGPNPVLSSNSGSHLPDMLTNTPEVSQITGDSSVTYNQPQQLADSVVAKDNLGINSEMPNRPATGLALGHASKTSCMENHAGNSAPPALLSSVSTGQPNCEQPKLRITSPFSAYSKKQSPDEDEKPSTSVPPSTLQESQGDLERKHEEIVRDENKISEQVFERNISVGNQLSHPGDIYNRVNQTLGRMNTDASAGHISNGIDGSRNSVQRSSLKRSDSYRRARPILSPDLSKNNRKSVEISPSNNSTNLSTNSSNISVGNSSSNKSTNNISGIQTPSSNSTANDKDQNAKEKSAQKGNFFKNIRSQFSFSSLRRKPSKKALVEISTPNNQQKSADIKRRNSFSSLSSSNKTPPDQPRMTSTPISDSSMKITNKNIEIEQPKVKPSTEWSDSPKNNQATPLKFRTAAMKNQHQRWSYAEQLQSNNQQSVHYMPNNASYGYIYPNQYVLAGHVNTPHGPNIYQHIHHQPHHHQVPPHNRAYGSYGPSTSNPIYCGSQRSSIASLRGIPHDPALATQTLTKYEAREEGAYGYSVLRRNSLSPPSKPPSDTASTGRSSQLSNPKSCDCPMCYHSVKNPCNDCGCPSRTSSLSLKVNVKQRGPAFTDQQSAQAFFSPSSDYYSLSPNSPPPQDLALNQAENGYSDSSESSQPIYAKVNKSKASEVKDNVSDKRNDESKKGRSVDKTNFDNSHSVIPKNGSVPMHHRSSTEPGKKPTAPERDLNFQKDKSGRRHSWAGDKKGPGIQKQTSLHDFKKLLAQQAMSQNPHRMSAKELLEKSVADKEAHDPCKSSQKSGGSLRKRSSPWKDNRFSVIQEEIEGSKENLLNGKN